MGFQWINIVGEPAPPNVAPVMVAAPHSSLFDMFLVSLNYIPSFIARVENKDVPLFGRELLLCMCVCFNLSRELSKLDIYDQSVLIVLDT